MPVLYGNKSGKGLGTPRKPSVVATCWVHHSSDIISDRLLRENILVVTVY
jgi:hypothetical protein